MPDTTSNLALPFLAAAQAQKHVTVNEALIRLDALVQAGAISRTTTSEPASPADGALYILPAGKTGTNWSGMSNGALAVFQDGLWDQIQPREGWLAFVRDTDTFVWFTGAAWQSFSPSNGRVVGEVTNFAGASARRFGCSATVRRSLARPTPPCSPRSAQRSALAMDEARSTCRTCAAGSLPAKTIWAVRRSCA